MKKAGLFLVIGLILGLALSPVTADLLKSALKVGGFVFLADKYGDDINDGLNSVMGSKNLKPESATKVVPVLSVGQGGFIGIVQVAGPRAQIDKVKAVAQLETGLRLPVIGRMRGKVLVPIEGRSPTHLKRVEGVGVSALIDVKL